MEAVRSDLQKEIWIKVGNAIFGLKGQILVEVNKKVAVLDIRIEAKLSETHQKIANTLQDIRETVIAARGS